MDLNQKIYENIRDQMLIALKTDKLTAQLRELNNERERAIGGMEILGQFYKDSTGKELQSDINAAPEWASLVKEAQAEAEQIAAGMVPASAENKSKPSAVSQPETPQPEVKGPETPKLRRVAGNRTVEVAQPAPEIGPPDDHDDYMQPAPQPTETQPTPQLSVTRGRNPVKIVIDDNPPGPGTPDSPD